MSDLTHVDFLQQAYRDDWQQYLASLKPNAKLGWDVCVLTAGDERQASMYRWQLEWRRTTNLLPAQTRCLIIADPDGQRVGSGGATLRVLALLANNVSRFGELLSEHEHWGINKRMDPGCTNDFIDHLFEVMSPHINGAKLAGAGGFAIIIARSRTEVRDLAAALKAHYGDTPVELWECDIPESGMLIDSRMPSVADRV